LATKTIGYISLFRHTGSYTGNQRVFTKNNTHKDRLQTGNDEVKKDKLKLG